MAGRHHAGQRVESDARPRLYASRVQRRRDRLAVEYAAAHTPAARLAVAFDFLRGAMASRRHPTPQVAAELAEDLAQQLIAAGNRLLDLQARERRNT